VHADTAFTPPERDALNKAADDWLGISKGRIHFTPIYDVDFSSTSSVVSHGSEAMIIRALAWMPIVDVQDTRISSRYGRRTRVYGWTESDPVRVYLVVDRIERLKEIAVHELGHAAGLVWPNCDPAREDCDHVNDRSSIMAAAYDDAQAFTTADLALCRASCLCP
jgi:hypothetical protein